MCCGSGKTFSQAFLARELIEESDDISPTIVCFVPNRGLILQNAANFRKVFGDSVDYLGVCSMKEAKSPPAGEAEDKFTFTMTTDHQEIRSHLTAASKPKIIFSTYQSADTTRDGLMLGDNTQMPVLLGLFDEAHRTAGEKKPGKASLLSVFFRKTWRSKTAPSSLQRRGSPGIQCKAMIHLSFPCAILRSMAQRCMNIRSARV